MITKLASLYFNGSDVFSARNVKGYNTAEFEITVADGTVSLGFYVTKDGTTPTSSSIKPNVYNSKGEYVAPVGSNYYNVTTGTHKFYVDISGCTNLYIYRNTAPASATLNLKQDVLDFSVFKKNKRFVFSSNSLLDVSDTDELDVTVTISNKTANVQTTLLDTDNNIDAKVFINNGVTTPPLLIDNKTYTFKVNCNGINHLQVNFRNCDFECTAVKVKQSNVFEDRIDKNILTPQHKYFYFENSGKQLDLVVEGFDVEANKPLYIQGSNDGVNYSDLPFYVKSKNEYRASNLYYNISSGEIVDIYANVEGYQYLRLCWYNKSDSNDYIIKNNEDKVVIRNAEVSSDYVEGRIIYGGFQTINAQVDKENKLFKGYHYFKIKFLDKVLINGVETVSNITNCSAFVGCYKGGVDMFRQNAVEVLDRGLNPITYSVQNHNLYKLALCGTPADGGYILKFNEDAEGLAFVPNKIDSRTGYSDVLAFSVECFVNMPKPETPLSKKYEKADYDVYQLPSDNTNRDVLNLDVLEWSDNQLVYWHGGYLGIKYVIPFASTNVAHYDGVDKIQFAYLLPFVGNNNRGVNNHIGRMCNPSRIVVFTKKQIFHNYPEWVGEDIHNTTSDVGLFDESTVYNTYKRWLPVNDKSKVTAVRKYFPVLAEYDYNQFDGRVNGTTGFEDIYGNGGLPADALLQDVLIDGVTSLSRLSYSSMTKTQKMSVFGNYNGVNGSEPFVMITDNGGKTWYVKSYFACTDDYDYMRAGKIDLTPITDVSGQYVSGTLRMCRKRFNLPNDEIKEPATPFIIEENDKSLVTAFTTDNDGNCIVTVADNVDYNGIWPIVYFEKVNPSSNIGDWEYICNTGFTADGETNNGIFFRVEKISANQYKLFADNGNPYEGDMVCRHIHAVNGVEAGILISTGETYGITKDNENNDVVKFEGGFIYLLVQNWKNGDQSLDMNYLVTGEYVRLTSSPYGINRACGAYLFSDNADPTILYVSDQCFPPNKRYASIDGRNNGEPFVPITPGGIYVGKLSEVDDQKKFRCVCELHTTIIGLLQANGHFAADGHGNSIMFSKDGFNWSIDVDDRSRINGFDNLGNIYFGNKVAMFK